MRSPLPDWVEAGRLVGHTHDGGRGTPYGAFVLFAPDRTPLRVIASGAGWDRASRREARGWEHVSVSIEDRTPVWSEMCFVKDAFWEPSECVVQFHPPASSYVNIHPFVLHLWRYVKAPFPMPPIYLV